MKRYDTQVNIMIPADIWDVIGEVADERKAKGEKFDTKKAIVAEALEEYCDKRGIVY